MDKDPDRRYQTAGAMAEDLRRYVNRFAISRRRPGPVERLRKWVRRHPGLAAGVALALVASALAGFFAFQSWQGELARIAAARQNALEKALLLTWQADFDGADRAIAEAEQLGASTGQLRMLQGQIALFRLEPDKAIGHLEQAVKLEPRNVAARALLAWAYLVGGSTDDFEEAMGELEELPAVTAEDYLYKGRVEAFSDPDRGLKTLEEAFRRRPSPLAYVVRAWVLTDRANVKNDPSFAELALADVSVIRTLLAENPGALAASAYAHLTAAAAFRATNQTEKARAAQAQGEKDALALVRFVDRVPEIAFNCAFYLQLVGQEDTALDVLQRANQQKPNSQILQLLACTLYRRGRYEEAVAILEKFRNQGKKDLFLDCTRAYILPELPGGWEQALAVCKEVVAGRPKLLTTHFTLTALLLLNKRELAVAGYREELAHPERWRALNFFSASPEFCRRLLEYGGERISAQELLQAVQPSLWDQCSAHYLIALSKLSQGNRDGAREHFQKCQDTNNFFAPEMFWSRAFLERLKKDRNWPPWIEKKKR